MENYDLESILDMYDDDYVPESRLMMAGGGRIPFDYGGIVRAFNELINEGKTTFKSRKELVDAIEAKTGKRPGGSFQASNNNYADLFKKITFTKPNIRTKQGDPEDYKINETQKKDLTKKVNKLNKKYKLDKKGIKVALGTTQSGNTTLQFQTNTNVWGNYFKDTLGISTRKSVTPNISGLNELEGYLKTITKSDLFKNYDKSAAMQKGGIESSKKQLENIGSKKPQVFNYLLNNQNATIEQIAKDLNLKQGVVTKNLQGLYTDIYKRYGDQGAVYLKEFDANQLNSVHNTIKNTKVKLKDRVKNLVIDAYNGDKNLKPLLKKIDEFYELQAKVKKTPYGKFFAGNLDHVIPLNFLRELEQGTDPMELIRIKPLPEFLNQRAFKAQFDRVLGTAYRTGNKEALEAIVNLQSYLPKEFGGITAEGKIIDYGAKPFTLKTNLSTTEFPEIYKRVFSFINNPDLQDTFDEAGVSFKSLKSKEKEIMKQAGGYNKLIEDIQNQKLKLAATVTEKCEIDLAKGGRIGFASGRNYCLNVGKQALEKGLKTGFPKNQQVLAEGILKASRSLKDIASIRGLLGPAALAFTAVAEAGFISYDMLSSGKSFKEAVGGNLFNYLLGDKTKIDLDKEIIKRLRSIPGAPSQGFREFSEEDIGKMQAFKSALTEMSDLNEQFSKLDTIQKNREALEMSPEDSAFSKGAFQLDREEDLVREKIQDFYRRSTKIRKC